MGPAAPGKPALQGHANLLGQRVINRYRFWLLLLKNINLANGAAACGNSNPAKGSFAGRLEYWMHLNICHNRVCKKFGTNST